MRIAVIVFLASLSVAAHAAGACPPLSEQHVVVHYLGTRSNCSSGTSTFCQTGEPVVFTASSFNYSFDCQPHTFYWDFGDGSPIEIGREVTHSYDFWGTHYAKLAVISSAAEIRVSTPVFVGGIIEFFPFSYFRRRDDHPRTVHFFIIDARTTGEWVWSFGDGTYLRSAAWEVEHLYATGGTYHVTLSSTRESATYDTHVRVPKSRARAAHR